jgi:hypothetical protein
MYQNDGSFAEGYAIGRDSNGGNNGFFGNDGIWAILLLALLGFGGRGYGGGFGGYGGAGNEFVGYELGKVATQADVASGFNNSAVLSSLNDLKLANAQGFAGLNTAITTGNAGIQQTLCQGFNGINTAILQSANATERGFATMGYNLANCCCEIKGAIADVKYANEKQTYDIVTNQNANTQRIIDYMQNEKITALTAENVALKGKISNDAQSAYLLSELKPCPKPAFITCNPNTGLTYPQGYTNVNFGNGCTGCGF